MIPGRKQTNEQPNFLTHFPASDHLPINKQTLFLIQKYCYERLSAECPWVSTSYVKQTWDLWIYDAWPSVEYPMSYTSSKIQNRAVS